MSVPLHDVVAVLTQDSFLTKERRRFFNSLGSLPNDFETLDASFRRTDITSYELFDGTLRTIWSSSPTVTIGWLKQKLRSNRFHSAANLLENLKDSGDTSEISDVDGPDGFSLRNMLINVTSAKRSTPVPRNQKLQRSASCNQGIHSSSPGPDNLVVLHDNVPNSNLSSWTNLWWITALCVVLFAILAIWTTNGISITKEVSPVILKDEGHDELPSSKQTCEDELLNQSVIMENLQTLLTKEREANTETTTSKDICLEALQSQLGNVGRLESLLKTERATNDDLTTLRKTCEETQASQLLRITSLETRLTTEHENKDSLRILQRTFEETQKKQQDRIDSLQALFTKCDNDLLTMRNKYVGELGTSNRLQGHSEQWKIYEIKLDKRTESYMNNLKTQINECKMEGRLREDDLVYCKSYTIWFYAFFGFCMFPVVLVFCVIPVINVAHGRPMLS